jgi:hypothetical protein
MAKADTKPDVHIRMRMGVVVQKELSVSGPECSRRGPPAEGCDWHSGCLLAGGIAKDLAPMGTEWDLAAISGDNGI